MQTKFMQTLYARQKIALLLTLFATSFFASAQSNSSEQIEMKGSKGTTVTGNVLTSFDNPWAMAFLPDGHSLVTEKAGSLWLLDENQQKRFAVSNVPSVVARGQGGLGDVIIHPDFASNIIRDILENNLPLIEKGEDVVMSPAAQDWRNQGVNWTFREHKRLRMGSNIWHLFSETDDKDGSGIFDIRAEIFFETNNAGEWVAFPQVPEPNTPQSGGIPYQQHRDLNYTIKGADNIYSPFNYYLIRDEENIPEIIMTAAEIGFLKAEAYVRGLGVEQSNSTAEGEYTIAVANSVDFWQNLVKGSQIWINAPDLLDGNEVFTIANHPRNDIFSQDNKLELIYRQRFIDQFRQPWEAYALVRRTNGATPHEGELIEHNRFPYPPSESINNPDNWAEQVAIMGEDTERVKVWWMK